MKLELGNRIAIWKKTGKDCRAVNHPVVDKNWIFADGSNGEIVSTSVVEEVVEYDKYMIVKTKNSIYKIVKM